MELNIVYFYTATILNWDHLLSDNKFKNIIIESLNYLVKNGKMKVYSFVIMPNHLHIIFKNLEKNGREMPYTSFMKFTGHSFLEELRKNESKLINKFKVERLSRNHQFWQRNSLPIKMYDKEILEQKLNYIHHNPLQKHWNLVSDPNDYYYSSCSFYEKEEIRFTWLSDYRDDF